jgi:hypothetical protein
MTLESDDRVVLSHRCICKTLFFTNNNNLAKAMAAPGAEDPTMLWEIRRQAIHFERLWRQPSTISQEKSMELPTIVHIRQTNPNDLSLLVIEETQLTTPLASLPGAC